MHRFYSEKVHEFITVPFPRDEKLFIQHEDFQLDWIQEYKPPFHSDNEPIIGIDVGACVGTFPIQIIKNTPNSYVFAFEPQSNIYQCLLANVFSSRLYDRIFPYNFAIGEREGKIILPVALGTGRSSITKVDGFRTKYIAQEEVNILSLDYFYDNILKHFQDKVDWVKIDVEGYEVEVLMGMKRRILDFKPLLIIEYHRNLSELQSILDDVGYIIAEHKPNFFYQKREGLIKDGENTVPWHGYIKAVPG